MAELKQLKFFVLRYVPDAVKGEFVNIGLLMREPDGEFSAVRITEDWSRVRCIDPEADLEVLTGIGNAARGSERKDTGLDLLVRKLEDLFSNVIQVLPVKACLAEGSEARGRGLDAALLGVGRSSREGGGSRDDDFDLEGNGIEPLIDKKYWSCCSGYCSGRVYGEEDNAFGFILGIGCRRE